MLDQFMAPALLAISFVTGSIHPMKNRLGRLAEGLLLTTCVISGALGVTGMMR